MTLSTELDILTELDDLAARKRISRSRLAERYILNGLAADREQQPVRTDDATAQ